MEKAVAHRDDEEARAVRQWIKQLKERERRIKEERYRLESKLRKKIFKRFREIEQRVE